MISNYDHENDDNDNVNIDQDDVIPLCLKMSITIIIIFIFVFIPELWSRFHLCRPPKEPFKENQQNVFLPIFQREPDFSAKELSAVGELISEDKVS